LEKLTGQWGSNQLITSRYATA